MSGKTSELCGRSGFEQQLGRNPWLIGSISRLGMRRESEVVMGNPYWKSQGAGSERKEGTSLAAAESFPFVPQYSGGNGNLDG